MPAEIKMDGFNMNKKNIIIIILALFAMNVSFTCKANDGWETIKIDRRVSDYAFKGIDQSSPLTFPVPMRCQREKWG